MHMKMRLARAASIADMTDYVTTADRLANLHAYSARPHMRIQYITMRRDLDDNLISGNIVKVDRIGERSRMRHVLGQAVGRVDYLASCDAVDRLVVAEIAEVVALRPLLGRAHAIDRLNLDPIDRIALREPRVPTQDHDGSAVIGIRTVVHGVAGYPLATQRRRDDNRAFVRDRQRRKHDIVRSAFVIEHAQRMLDRNWGFVPSKVEHEEDQNAAAGLDGAV